MFCMASITTSLSRRSFLAVGTLTPALLPAAKPASKYLVYFGTYTRKTSKGIYVSTLDAATGKLSEPELAGETPNPSFVAIHPNLRFLYSVSEAGSGGVPGNTVTAFSIDKASGKLTKLNTLPAKGEMPCHLNVDKTGRALVVANYGSGSTVAMKVNADGSLSEGAGFIQHKGSSVDRRRQQGPHAHSANISFDNRFVVVADLGLDQVLVYKFDPTTAGLAPNDPPYVSVKPGSGPRHFTFHPKGKFAYVINEMASTVTAFRWDAKAGSFTEIETVSTLPPGDKTDNTTAEVVAHPSGKFLYGSNRGHNSLAVFAIDRAKGTLKLTANVPTQGQIPRNFAIEPGGRWLLAANQNSDNVVVFSVDPASGMLNPTGQAIQVGMPVCVRYVPL
jgi:6-phosphogluconolactonase